MNVSGNTASAAPARAASAARAAGLSSVPSRSRIAGSTFTRPAPISVAAHLLGGRPGAVVNLAAALVHVLGLGGGLGDGLHLVDRSLGRLELLALRDDGTRLLEALAQLAGAWIGLGRQLALAAQE